MGRLVRVGELFFILNDGDGIRLLDIGCNLIGRWVEIEGVDFLLVGEDLFFINVLFFINGLILWFWFLW